MSSEWEYMKLRSFTEAELILDEQETKDVLKFFFQMDRQIIESTQVNDPARNLAQGLLVAAVDASYAMGWVEATFRWSVNPGAGVKKALQKLAGRAARYWFKHLRSGQSLSDAKIYESVRDQLARNFRSHFRVTIQAQGLGQKKQLAACLKCGMPKANDRLWC